MHVGGERARVVGRGGVGNLDRWAGGGRAMLRLEGFQLEDGGGGGVDLQWQGGQRRQRRGGGYVDIVEGGEWGNEGGGG